MLDNILYWNFWELGSLKKRLKSIIFKNEIYVCAIDEPFVGSNRSATLGDFLSLYNNFCSNEVVGGKL